MTHLNAASVANCSRIFICRPGGGLELANQGGARAKVKTVDLQSIDIVAASEPDAFRATTVWNVAGSVGHWGHVHTRTNQYNAEAFDSGD